MAEITNLQSPIDEKSGCQMGKNLILMGKKSSKHVSLMGFQNDATEEHSLPSMFGEKTQERQHLP